jgi:hypothetical protein
MRSEVIPRLKRNYGRRSLVFHRFLRRKRGNYWKLLFRAPGEFVSAQAGKLDLIMIQQAQQILDQENPRNGKVERNGQAGHFPGIFKECHQLVALADFSCGLEWRTLGCFNPARLSRREHFLVSTAFAWRCR